MTRHGVWPSTNQNKPMNRFLIISLMLLAGIALHSCEDHDDPQLAPIDTTQVRIKATVNARPGQSWLNVTEQLTISVSDVAMTAPKGVVLRSVSLIASNGMTRFLIDDKPFSGEPLEFKVPLVGKQGRLNFSLRGNLIKQDCRDAEVIIADNIERIVFSETPEFECEGCMVVSVKGTSSTGEEYTHSFEARSTDHFTLPVPQSELYWTPTSGTAPTIEVTLGSGAKVWSPNTTFKSSIISTSIGKSTDDGATLKLTLPNTPGSLNSMKLKLYVLSSFYGSWEGVTIDPHDHLNVFGITETE